MSEKMHSEINKEKKL